MPPLLPDSFLDLRLPTTAGSTTTAPSRKTVPADPQEERAVVAMAEAIVLKGVINGHTDVVTAIATPIDNSDKVISASRDKSVLVWHLTKDSAPSADGGSSTDYGVPSRHQTGHSHFVQDFILSFDGQFALSGSWDGELRLWDIGTGATTAASLATLRTSFLSHSLSTTARTCLPPATAASRSRTPSGSANTPSRTATATQTGSAASVSAPTPSSPPSSLPPGTAPSRSGTSTTASSGTPSPATAGTPTRSPSDPTGPFAPAVGRTG